MTRRQAIRLILQFLDEAPELDENLCKAKYKLQEMLNGIPGKIWDDATIRSAIERFIDENGRPPKVKELDAVEYLPPHPCIYQQYKMTAGKWLNDNYPMGANADWRIRYGNMTQGDFRALFEEEYNRIMPASSLAYNRNRREGTPSWQYIAKALSVSTWKELKALCEIDLPKQRKGEMTFLVTSQILDLDRTN